MKITVLTENTSKSGLSSEHGLSLYIRTDNHNILFDAGQTGLFAENAEALGIDLAKVDIAVLSHGHYDHGGGLKRFLQLNKTALVYMSEYAFEPHYRGEEKYIGLDLSLSDSGRVILTRGITEIDRGLTLFSCGDMKMIMDMGSFGLNAMRNGRLVADDFRHEHYLMIEENGRRVLFSGCSHKGIVNIADRFRPDVLIGGFHLSKLEPGDELRAVAERLDSYPTRYFTCHCTGVEQYRFMKGFMDRLGYISAGDSITV